MALVKILFILLSFSVAAEFALHIWYQYKVGGAGIYDPAFEYLKNLDKLKGGKKR